MHITKLTSYINTIDEQYDGDTHKQRAEKRQRKKGIHSTISKWIHTMFDGTRVENKLINIHSSLALLSIMHGNNHKKSNEDENLSCKTFRAHMYFLFFFFFIFSFSFRDG